MRRRTPAFASALAAVALLSTAAGYALAGRAGGAGAHPAAAGTTKPPPTSTGVTDTVPATTTAAPPSPAPAPPKPAITRDRIPYGATRRAEMAGYAHRHYGVRSFRLHPRLIVLHFTASGAGSYPGVHATFAANTASMGELPGVCAHF